MAVARREYALATTRLRRATDAGRRPRVIGNGASQTGSTPGSPVSQPIVSSGSTHLGYRAYTTLDHAAQGPSAILIRSITVRGSLPLGYRL